MNRQLRKAAVLAAAVLAGGMTASTITANAAQWRDDAKGWWIENDDGSYLVNQWYQSPSSGLWYYIGADGYMLTNTMTPDGCYVNANGVWVQNANPGTQQAAGVAKDVAAIQQVAEAYKDWYKSNSAYARYADSFVFCDIDGDGIPECVGTNGERWFVITHHGEKVEKTNIFYGNDSHPLYVPGGNVLCDYGDKFYEDRAFYKINDKGAFEKIGTSKYINSTYNIPTRSDTSKAIYDDYNASFGQLEEISIEYEDPYRSIDEACAAYLAQ